MIFPLISNENVDSNSLYGRRRVGKTELIEQTYAKRNLIKIEGIEGRDEVEQRKHVLFQISHLMREFQ